MLLCENALMPHSCCKHSRDLSTPRPSEWFGKGPSGAPLKMTDVNYFPFSYASCCAFCHCGSCQQKQKAPICVGALSFLRFAFTDLAWRPTHGARVELGVACGHLEQRRVLAAFFDVGIFGRHAARRYHLDGETQLHVEPVGGFFGVLCHLPLLTGPAINSFRPY